MIHKYMFIAKQLSPVLCCNSISLEEPSRYVDMLSHPYYGFAQLRATIMRIVFDARNSSLSFQRNIQISIERPGVKNCPNPRMFLTITFLPYGLPQILLHILNEHDEYFQTIYSLLGNSMIRILNIRQHLRQMHRASTESTTTPFIHLNVSGRRSTIARL